VKAENHTILTADGAPVDLAAVPCPNCRRVGTLELEMRMEAKGLGTYSIAGVQPKLVASEVPYLVCGECSIAIRGKR